MPTLDENGLITPGKHLTLLPYIPRPFIKREYMTDAELLQHAGTDLILDGEFYPNYGMFGFKHIKTGKYLVLENDYNPRKISWIMFSYRTIGFNSIHFDLPLVWASYHNRHPAFLKAVTNGIIQQNMRPDDAAKEFGFTIYRLPRFQHIDLIEVCPLGGSLKLYGARLHSKRLQDLPFAHDEALEDWQKDVVREYNANDLDVTELVFTFDKMQERLELRRSISIDYDLDLMSKSDAQMAEAVISKEVGKLNKRYVKRPVIEPGTTYKYEAPLYLSYRTPAMQKMFASIKRANFTIADTGKMISPPCLSETVTINKGIYTLGIGGLHSNEKCVGYEAKSGMKLKDTDVVSYYPNAIVNLRLIPIAMGPNFLTVYEGFKKQRVEAKRAKQFTKDKGLKIFLNGVSGKLSDKYSTMYSPNLTIQMNLTGQLSILMLVEMFELNGIEVVSANTDGVVAYYNEAAEEKLEYYTNYWRNLTGFDTETVEYTKYYARDVNNYFAVKEDGVKVKGVWSEVGSQSGTQLDNNPIMLICSDAIKALLTVGTPIDKTIMACQNITRFIIVRQVKGGAAFRGEYLGKVVRWYYSDKSIDCIQTVTHGSRVATSENCMPLMDIATDLPTDLDRARYIELTKSYLYDIGYYKKPERVMFF
jgi:hypothetical protein